MTEGSFLSIKVIHESAARNINLNQPNLQELHNKIIENYPELTDSFFFLEGETSPIFSDIDLANAVERMKQRKESLLEFVTVVADDPIEASIFGLVKEELQQVEPRLKEIAEVEVKAQLDLQKLSEKKSTVIHKGITCKECGVNPILGARFKCTICNNYNLCEACEEKEAHSHLLLKIYSPEGTHTEKSKVSFEVTEADRQEEKKMLSQSQAIAPQRRVRPIASMPTHYGEQYFHAFPKVKNCLQSFNSKTSNNYYSTRYECQRSKRKSYYNEE